MARLLRLVLAALAVVSAAFVTAPAPVSAGPADSDWLGVVNAYREMSGVPPVVEDAQMSAAARLHSCYQVYNGIGHDEIPGRRGYTVEGDESGNASNVATWGSHNVTARQFVELWMTGPFHTIGVLRPGLARSGYAACQDPEFSNMTAATLNVISGIEPIAWNEPVLFPGPGSRVRLNRFIAEWPDPVEMCGWTAPAGLPLIAMLPAQFSTVSASLSGPSGELTSCTLSAHNTSGVARNILDIDHAVLVVPREPLADGRYTATVTTEHGPVTWSFEIDQNAPLPARSGDAPPGPLPDTSTTAPAGRFAPVAPHRIVDSRTGDGLARLRARTPARLHVTDDGSAVAVSANFTVDRPAAPGFLTVYDCGEVPLTSNVNFADRAVPNASLVPVDANGDICLYASADTDVIVDVNGWVLAGSDVDAARLSTVPPARLADTRSSGRLAAGSVLRVKVAGRAGVAADAAAAVLNVTVVDPAASGYLSVYGCDGERPFVSNTNFVAGETRAAAAVSPLSGSGEVCVFSLVDADVLVDVSGFFAAGAGLEFAPVTPLRLADTRSSDPRVNAGSGGFPVAARNTIRVPVAGVRGLPADAAAATVNVTVVSPGGPGHLTVFPCGARPEVSAVNYGIPGVSVVPNLVTSPLSAGGELCVYTHEAAAIVVDVTGVWVPAG